MLTQYKNFSQKKKKKVNDFSVFPTTDAKYRLHGRICQKMPMIL